MLASTSPGIEITLDEDVSTLRFRRCLQGRAINADRNSPAFRQRRVSENLANCKRIKGFAEIVSRIDVPWLWRERAKRIVDFRVFLFIGGLWIWDFLLY